MKLTPTLYVRSWIAKLHPPVATTPQENKQLLSLLGSSFKKRLDDVHPPVQPAEPRISGPLVDNASARATIEHLQSVLHHPLLTPNPIQPSEAQSAAATAVMMMDQAMIDGRANLEVVEECMQMYSETLKNGNAVTKDEHRLGRKISAWYTTSSTRTKHEFLSSPAILRYAVPILYAEGLEEVVWEWLRTLYSRTIDFDNPQQQACAHTCSKPLHWVIQESYLTFLMIKEALRRGRLDAAVVQINQTCAYMQSTGRMSSEACLLQTWQATVKSVTLAILRRRHRHGLSAQLFDDFLEHRQSWSDSNSLTFELISLYHPIRPSAKELAIAVEQRGDQIKAHFDGMKAMSELAQKTMLNALLDGAQLLLKGSSNSDEPSLAILNLVQNQHPALAGEKDRIVTQKDIQSVRNRIGPSVFMPALAGVT